MNRLKEENTMKNGNAIAGAFLDTAVFPWIIYSSAPNWLRSD
jgi:hypothetical protein